MSSAEDLFRADALDDEEELEEEEEDGEDEEEYEEEEEEEAYNHARGTKRKRVKTGFLDLEADVGDEEEEDEYEEDLEGFVDDDVEDVGHTSEPSRAQYLRQGQRMRSPRRSVVQEMDAEALAEQLDQRYRRRATHTSSEIPQSLLLPGVDEAHLWLVRCKPGKEKLAVDSLMRRFFDSASKQGTSMQIRSVFQLDSLKGYVYIEAMKQDDVKNAIQGLPHLYVGNMRLVPIKEMVDVLTVSNRDSKKEQLVEGQWVRIRPGKNKYSGDLGRVVDIDDSGQKVMVKMVPRLDWDRLEKQEKATRQIRERAQQLAQEGDERGAQEELQGLKRTRSSLFSGLTRPQQKLFSYSEVPKLIKPKIQHAHGGRYFQLGTELFDRKGYVEKQFKLSTLVTQNVAPTLEELSKFTTAGRQGEDDDVDIETISQLAQSSIGNSPSGRRSFHPGELVKVRGEGIEATVVSTENDVAVLRPLARDFTQTLSVPIAELQKNYKAGDHVRVLAGRHKNTTGMVVKVHKNVAWLITDGNHKEIQTLTRDLGEASDISTEAPTKPNGGAASLGRDRIPEYDLFDLVSYEANTWGVIVKMGSEVFHILNWNGELVRVIPAQIRSKRGSRGTTTSDRHGIMINVGDNATVAQTNHTGSVLHIFKNFVWIRTKELTNNGVFVTQRNQVVAVNQHGHPIANDSRFANRRRGRGRGRGRGGSFGGGGHHPFRRHEMLNRTVKVISGMYKGYLGIVKDITDVLARVELHTNCKTINVEISKLVFKERDGVSNLSIGGDYGSGGGGGGMGGMSPAPQGSRSPATWGGAPGGRTPSSWGSRGTPSHSGGRTPNPYSQNSGVGDTWGAGSRTPAHRSSGGSTGWGDSWGSGSTGGGIGDGDSWAAGARTPAHPSGDDDGNWISGGAGSASGSVADGGGGWGDSNERSDGGWGNASTPAYTPGTPALPGGASTPAPAGDSWGATPSETAPTGGEGWDAPTPGAGGGWGSEASPAGGGWGSETSPRADPVDDGFARPDPYTGRIAQTPNARTPAGSDTPFSGGQSEQAGVRGAGEADSGLGYGWPLEDVEVTIAPSRRDGTQFQGGQHDHQRCKVVSVRNGGTPDEVVSVASLESSGLDQLEVPTAYLTPVVPSKKDHVVVLSGTQRDLRGNLVGVDGEDAIMKFDTGTSYDIIPMRALGKLVN